MSTNINYIGIVNNKTNDTKITSNDELSKILDTEYKIYNTDISWQKLNKTLKLQKLYDFVDNKLKNKHKLDKETILSTKLYLKTCLNRKKLQKNNELEYDNENGEILNINNLIFKNNKNFTLKNKSKSKPKIKQRKVKK
jgi:hypothetical protein